MIRDEFALEKINQAIKNYHSRKCFNTFIFDYKHDFWDITSHAYIHMKKNKQLERINEDITFCWAMYAVNNFISQSYKAWKKVDRLDAGVIRERQKELERNKYKSMVDIQDEAAFVLNNTKLSENERLVIKLRFTDDLTYKEIAKELGVTYQRVGQILNKAISKMRDVMGVDPEKVRHRHPAGIKDKGREYYLRNIEDRRAYQRAYCHANK